MARPKTSKRQPEARETGLVKRDPMLEALKEVERLTAEAHAMAASGGAAEGESQALVPVGDRKLAAPGLKAQLAKTRAMTLKKQQQMQKAAKNLESLMASKVQALQAAMAPLQQMVAQATEMIWTVNLYLGRDEEIVMLRDGKPAPVGTTLSVRQAVLAADEESMVSAEEGGIDAQKIDEFDEWLLASPAHLQQVLPEEKGVVVFMPRRQRKEYGNAFEQASMDQANQQSYWLIRNGERLYRMKTDFNVGNTLVPKSDEFVKFFVERSFNFETHEYETVQLQPGSYAWIKAEEHSDARRRHHMRAALILQGLIDRTPVFHPLPPGGLNLLKIDDYEAGKVRVIMDAENLLGEGTEPFKDWLKRLNGELTLGMRITGNFQGVAWREANRRERDYTRHSRISPGGASVPESGKLYQIEEKLPHGNLRFRYERTDEIWDQRNWEVRKSEKRASCLISPSDEFILPFDLVTIQEMQHYLQLRTERHNYVEMVPLLKSAIAAKQAEEDQEEPFRKLIVGQLMASAKLDYEESVAMMPGLVDWWKLAHRWHRPLVNEPEAEAKALKMILAEASRRKRAQALSADADWLAQGRLQPVGGLLAIYQKRDGSYLGLAEQEEPYLRHYTLAKTGRGEVKLSAEWQLPTVGLKLWRQVWAGPKWKTWPMNASASDHLSGPEKQAAVEEMLAQVADGRTRDADKKKRQVMLIGYQERDRNFEIWLAPEQAQIDYQHLLTVGVAHANLPFWEVGWKRTKGGRVLIEVEGGWPHEYSWADSEPWQKHAGQVLFEDQGVMAQAREWKTEAGRASEQARKLFDKMLKLEESIKAAWLQIEEEREHARFREDYQDEDLWEGHRKTLKHQEMPAWREVRTLTDILVEHGIDIVGMTLAEARTEALKVAGDQTATVDEDGWKQEPRGVVPTEESLAAVATLRYSKLRHKRNDD